MNTIKVHIYLMSSLDKDIRNMIVSCETMFFLFFLNKCFFIYSVAAVSQSSWKIPEKHSFRVYEF